MPRRSTLPLATMFMVMSGACATGGESGSTSRSRDLITMEELMAVPHSSVFEAVRALRPRWLLSRGSASLGSRNPQRDRPTARVYVDGQLRGGLNELWALLPSEVGEIRYMSASDATTRFGTNHIAGAIVVTTRRR